MHQSFSLDKEKFKAAELRDGHYLMRSNLTGDNPEKLWELYTQLVNVEAAFKCCKSDLAIRPIHHHLDNRIEVHLFISFMAYCLTVTLKKRMKTHAPGLTPIDIFQKLATIIMLEVHIPTHDGTMLVMPRYTQPEQEHLLILEKLTLTLPPQPPPRIYTPKAAVD